MAKPYGDKAQRKALKQAELDEKMALKKITTIMVELEELERITKGSENDLGIDIREQFIKVKSSLIRIEQASISNTHIVRHQWVTFKGKRS